MPAAFGPPGLGLNPLDHLSVSTRERCPVGSLPRIRYISFTAHWGPSRTIRLLSRSRPSVRGVRGPTSVGLSASPR